MFEILQKLAFTAVSGVSSVWTSVNIPHSQQYRVVTKPGMEMEMGNGNEEMEKR